MRAAEEKWMSNTEVILVIVGASNAVNLTDGLDGLASGCCVIAFSALRSLLLRRPAHKDNT